MCALGLGVAVSLAQDSNTSSQNRNAIRIDGEIETRQNQQHDENSNMVTRTSVEE